MLNFRQGSCEYQLLKSWFDLARKLNPGLKYGTIQKEIGPAFDNRRRCKKNSPSVLSYIGKRTKEGCDCGREARQFTAAEAGMDHFL